MFFKNYVFSFLFKSQFTVDRTRIMYWLYKAMTSMAEFLYFFRCKHDVQTRIASTCNTTTTNDDDIDELLLRLSPLLSCTTVYLREKIYINSIPYITINTKRWDVHTYMACLVMQLSKRRNLWHCLIFWYCISWFFS